MTREVARIRETVFDEAIRIVDLTAQEFGPMPAAALRTAAQRLRDAAQERERA